MKKVFLLMAVICLLVSCSVKPKKQIADGLYLVEQFISNPGEAHPTEEQQLISFNPDFIEEVSEEKFLLVNTADFVPLELSSEPELLPQTEQKKKLQLSFSQMAAEKLEKFTAEHVMRQATLVVGGQALTVRKIREAIKGGKMEITECSGNACEHIYVTLKKDVKK